MIDEALKCFVWKFVFVCKIKVVKNLVELRTICVGEFIKNLVELVSDSLGLILNDFPSAIFGYLKTVIVIGFCNLLIVILFKDFFIFLVPHIAYALVEQKSENIFFVVGAVYFSAQDVSTSPKKLLELGEIHLSLLKQFLWRS